MIANSISESFKEALNKIFGRSIDGMLMVDSLQRKFCAANRTFCRMTSYSLKEINSLRIEDIHPKEDISIILKAFHLLLTGKISVVKDVRIKRKDGSIFYCDIWASMPVVLASKRYLVGIFKDATERRRVEENLRFSNMVLSSQQAASPDGILVVDARGKIISFNRRFIHMWGIPQEVIRTKSDKRAIDSVLDKLIKPEEFLQKVRYLYAHPREASRDELVLRDGRRFERYSTFMSGDDGRPYGRIWYFRDITEAKKALDEIRLAKEYIELVFRLTPSAIFAVDKDRRITKWNKMAETITGYSVVEVLGKKCTIFTESPCKEKCGLYSNDILKPIIARECKIKTKDGSLLIISKNADLIRDVKGNIVGGIESFENVTDRKLFEERLRKAFTDLKYAQKMLIQSEKLSALGQMASGLAHEIKNPLSVTLGGLEFLEYNLPKAGTQVREAISKSKDALKRADSIIHRLLGFSMPSKSQLEKVRLSDLVGDVLNLLKLKTSLRNIRVIVDCSTKNDFVRVDRVQVEQVFFNILLNALEAMPKGGSIKIKVSRDHRNRVCVAQIKDSGKGVSKEALPRLFEPFFTTKKKKKGVGLGLWVAKLILVNHKGGLSVKSILGKGTELTIILPQA